MSDSNRPYRVGMARPAQRYIEPDEIYEGLRRGAPTRIPAQFPFTWNPVNGYIDAEYSVSGVGAAGMSGALEDAFNSLIQGGQKAAAGVVKDTTSAAQDASARAIEDFINSTPGHVFLDKVQQKAADGVTGVVKQQGLNLILLAVAGGAVGGALSSKLGKTGTVLALLVGGYAAMQIVNAVAPTPPKK